MNLGSKPFGNETNVNYSHYFLSETVHNSVFTLHTRSVEDDSGIYTVPQ